MPLHLGHVALIQFARSSFDQVIVSMSYQPSDPIPAELRFQWLQESFPENEGYIVRSVLDDFDQPNLPMEQRTASWAEVIRTHFPGIDALVSSEEYGSYLSIHLGIRHILFDALRSAHPVSATWIRQNAPRWWPYTAPVTRPFLLKKFCFMGAESTGKSTMAQRMAAHYQTNWVPEVAREMITSNDFSESEIVAIGRAQTERVHQLQQSANRFLFCDTDLITTQVYSKHYLNIVPEQLYELETSVSYDHYFLFDIDVPWVEDGLRDLPHFRTEMHKIFQGELERRNIPFTLVTGSFGAREKILTDFIDTRLTAEVWS